MNSSGRIEFRGCFITAWGTHSRAPRLDGLRIEVDDPTVVAELVLAADGGAVVRITTRLDPASPPAAACHLFFSPAGPVAAAP